MNYVIMIDVKALKLLGEYQVCWYGMSGMLILPLWLKFIRVGEQLTTGGSVSDVLQDLYKSLQVDPGQTINSVDDGGGVIQWQEHNIMLLR